MDIPATPDWLSDAVELFILRVEHVDERYVSWLNDPETNRYLESRFTLHTLTSTQQFVHECLTSDAKLLFGIRALQTKEHVGNVKLEIDRHHSRADIGILVGQKAWRGAGIATSAIRAVIRVARNELKLRKLSAGCYASNKGSERAFIKAGFQVEARCAQHFLCEGKAEDLILMGMIL